MDRQLLVADWRTRLAEAESTPGSSQRQAWLNRVRIRLYRFLLSLYGEGDWRRTPQSAEDDSPAASQSALIVDSPSVLPLAGKPAKDVSAIQSVLKSVAGAQEGALKPGPLVDGLPSKTWAVVATDRDGIDMRKSLLLLTSHGLRPRLVLIGHENVVEVSAEERSTAVALIAANFDLLLRPPPVVRVSRPLPRWCVLVAMTMGIFVVSMPLAWMISASLSTLEPHSHAHEPLTHLVPAERFAAVWGGLYLLLAEFFLLHVLLHHHTTRARVRVN